MSSFSSANQLETINGHLNACTTANQITDCLPVACNFHRKSNLDVTSVCCACRINATISPIITTNIRIRIQNDSSIGLRSNAIFRCVIAIVSNFDYIQGEIFFYLSQTIYYFWKVFPHIPFCIFHNFNIFTPISYLLYQLSIFKFQAMIFKI